MDSPLQAKLSISIVNYDSSDVELRSLLQSLLTAIEFAREEIELTSYISLIDNSPENRLTLKSFSELQEQSSSVDCEIKLIQGQGNIGFGAGHNIAINQQATLADEPSALSTDNNYHLICNPDVIVDESSIANGIRFLLSNDDINAISPFAAGENERQQFLCKQYPSVLTFLIRGFFPSPLKKFFKDRLARFEMQELANNKPCKNVKIISGCFMLCRLDKLIELRGFDPGYFVYFEDFDLSLRLGKLAYTPDMKIHHSGGHAAKKGIKHIAMFARSGYRFFHKHGWQFIKQESRSS